MGGHQEREETRITKKTTKQLRSPQPRAESQSWSVRSRRSFRDTRAPRTVWRALAGLLLLAVAAVPVLPAPAQAATLVSNLGQGTATETMRARWDIEVQGFQTGTNPTGYSLTNVQLHIDSFVTPATIADMKISLRTRAIGSITEPVSVDTVTFVNPTFTSAGTYTFTLPVGTTIDLTPDTVYYVGIDINNADGDGGGDSGVALGTTTANDEDSGAAAGWTIHDISFWHDSGVWNANAYKYRIAVNATPNNTPATGLPTITGTAQVGQTLTAATTGIADTDGKTKAENGDTGYAYTYQWVRVDGSNETDITGAASKTYIPAAADVGKTIKVQVSFTDDAGNPESLTSDPAGPVAQTVPIGLEANYPSIGAGLEDLVFTLTRTGAVKDELERTVSIVQAQKWLGASDLSRTVTVARSDEVRTRAPATGKPSIRGTEGTAWVGGTLTVVTKDIEDEDGLSGATYGYQWVRVDADGMSNATDITSETSDTYVPVEADVGKKVRVKVSFTDDGGDNEELTSDAYPSSGTIEAEAPGICERTRQVRVRILDRISPTSVTAPVSPTRVLPTSPARWI